MWISVARHFGPVRRQQPREYPHVHRFAVLPSRKSPRLLLPIEDRRTMLEGLQIYEPYTPVGRLLKFLLVGAIKAGWQGWAGDQILLATRQPLALERLVQDVTGEAHPSLALSLGSPNSHCKLTVQAMRPGGETLGYIKLPLRRTAVERVRHEAGVLSRLWDFEYMRPHIPRVLHAGEWEGSYLLFQSPGPISRGPVEFGPMHEGYFQRLWSVQTVSKPGHAVVEEVSRNWRALEPAMNDRWRELGSRALGRARAELNGIMIPCGVMHGDFGPSHTRVRRGELYVFDWEVAAWDAPNLWDIFNFHLMSWRGWNRDGAGQFPRGNEPGERASFLLYLLDSLCGFFVEGRGADDPGVVYRERWLANELCRPPVQVCSGEFLNARGRAAFS
ncbi:MAG: hypothetical protein HY237_02825 [Acidobacteria bacterium]|nr:hypothetical protein [Acidobacteriota bacterium]